MKIDAADWRFLREMARDVVEASRVRPGERVGNSPANTSGHTLIRPGGRTCYPAMWVRDFSMSIDSGLISDDEILAHYRFIAARMSGAAERTLKSGGVIPPDFIPDHINFDGGAVFFPGAYSAGEDQGGEPFGVCPPLDDNFEFVHLGHRLQLRDDGMQCAFDAVPSDPATGGMVITATNRRAVGFGFYDTVYLTGALLFSSLLRYRAATELDRRDIAAAIASHLVPIFSDHKQKHGWLFAATGIGRQPDVWGTLYALHLGILPEDFATRARQTVADAVHRGTISCHGAVRHLPTVTGGWERTSPTVAINTYQNGAYWHTPTGWLISALHRSHPELATAVFGDYIAHLRQQDFRRGEKFGAPWECFFKNGQARQNPVYMTSVTLPLSIVQQIEASI